MTLRGQKKLQDAIPGSSNCEFKGKKVFKEYLKNIKEYLKNRNESE